LARVAEGGDGAAFCFFSERECRAGEGQEGGE
jgi:hypothetical protein